MSSNKPARKPMDSIDAAWLHMDEPTNQMVITICTIFDQPLDLGQVRSAVERRLLPFARLRQRVTTVNGQPNWETVPQVSLGYHIRRVGVPGVGDEAGLLELIGDIMSTPLDPAQPLWQITLAERYGKGCAIIVRLHHCIGDGVAIGYMFDKLLDDMPQAAGPTTNGHSNDHKAHSFTGALGALEAAIEGLGTAVRKSEAVINDGLSVVTHPERVLDIAGRGVSAVSKIALMNPDSLTTFKGTLSIEKRAAWTKPVPLAEIKALGKVLGGTLNDVMLTAAAGGMRRYLQANGESADHLTVRGLMPVNLLPPGSKPPSGNHFGMVYVELPVSIEDPVERIAAVHKETMGIKSSPEAALGYGILNAMGVTPLNVEHAMVDLLCSRATAVVTNVPGPQTIQYFCGKPIRNSIFWVPQAGRLGIGLSIFSYKGEVQMGIATDAALVPDAAELAMAIDAELQELIGLEQAVGA
jgi:diacylglycerol O-acyltransferase